MIVDIQSINNFTSDKYGKCLLVETFPIIDSPFGWGGCVDMSRTTNQRDGSFGLHFHI